MGEGAWVAVAVGGNFVGGDSFVISLGFGSVRIPAGVGTVLDVQATKTSEKIISVSGNRLRKIKNLLHP